MADNAKHELAIPEGKKVKSLIRDGTTISILEQFVAERKYTIYVGRYHKIERGITWTFQSEVGYPNHYFTKIGKEDSKESTSVTARSKYDPPVPPPLTNFVFDQKEGADNVDFTIEFISWYHPVIYSPTDVYSNIEDLPSRCDKRVYYYRYKPACPQCSAVDNAPLFVVLNGPPFSEIYTSSLCREIGKSYECISVDCLSLSKSHLYGDTTYASVEEEYMKIKNREYRTDDWAEEIKAVTAIINKTLSRKSNEGLEGKRVVIIISTLFTSYYAMVLSGSYDLQKYTSNIMCIFTSSCILPGIDKETTETKAFCESTTYTSQLTNRELKAAMVSFINKLLSKDEEEILKNKHKTKNDRVSSLKVDVDWMSDEAIKVITRPGVPEKSCFLIEKCYDEKFMHAVYQDIIYNATIRNSEFLYFVPHFVTFNPNKQIADKIRQKLPFIALANENLGLWSLIGQPSNIIESALCLVDGAFSTSFLLNREHKKKFFNDDKTKNHYHEIEPVKLPDYESIQFWNNVNY